MTPYAQTNIQLYNQLRAAAWSDADLQLVHTGYQLAVALFAGQLRPNQKSFLAHLVGAASVLAAHGAAPGVVTAGLLHSSYSHGEFGDGSRGTSPAKRRSVRSVVGEQCETLVAAYAQLRWDVAELDARIAAGQQLSGVEPAVVFMRLADLLEEYLDEGMSYSPRKRLAVDAESQLEQRDTVVRLAAALGHAGIASELRAALDPGGKSEPPVFLRGFECASYLVAPLSHRRKFAVRFGRFYRRWRDKLLRTVRDRKTIYSSTASASPREPAINLAAPSSNNLAATHSPRAAA